MMPSTSKKQHNFMAAIANSPSFAKKAGVPTSVGKDFVTADKGKKFSKGGNMKKMNMGGYADGGMPMVMKDGKKVPSFAADGKGKMASGGMTKDDQFDADVKRVKSSSYMNKDDDRVYSRERGLSPGIARARDCVPLNFSRRALNE